VDLASFRRWTLSDEFPTIGRIDYVAGNIEIDLTCRSLWRHSSLKTFLGGEMGTQTKGAGSVFIGETRLVSSCGDFSTEPDILYVSWDSLRSRRVICQPSANPRDALDQMELEGGPDLIVEVISPSSVSKDTERLPPLYFAAGAREYWLADARGKEAKLTIFCRGKNAFEPVAKDRRNYQYSNVLGESVRLTFEPGPVANTLVYTLHRKAK